MIISFLNTKGGVGKTTLCVNLSRYLYLYKYRILNQDKAKNEPVEKPRILLVDADPQGSLRDWQEAGCQVDIDVIAADRRQTLAQLSSLLNKQAYDYVLIDTPGKAADITSVAITLSDLCVIPVQPSPYDLWASNDIAELIEIRQTIANGKPKAFYVLNRCIALTNIYKEADKYLCEQHFPIIGRAITQRVIYSASAKNGQTVFDYQNMIAQEEISALGRALIKQGELNDI